VAEDIGRVPVGDSMDMNEVKFDDFGGVVCCPCYNMS